LRLRRPPTLEHVERAGPGLCGRRRRTDPLEYNASAFTDGDTAEQSTTAPDAQARLCENEASILRLITDPEVFESIKVFEADIQDVAGRQLRGPLRGARGAVRGDEHHRRYTNGAAPTAASTGAGAVAGVTPLTIVGTAPFSELPGFEETPLGDISVNVAAHGRRGGRQRRAGADAPAPAGPDPDPAPEPEEDLPVTGAGAGLLGLAAMAGAVALRRRDDE
jgi:hypothetical protein